LVVVIEFKKLPAECKLAAQFLESRIDLPLKTKGTQVLVEGGRSRDLKLLLHKFLHQRGFDGYRIVHEPGAIVILPPEERDTEPYKEERPRWEGLSPFRMNPTTTVMYPNYPPSHITQVQETEKVKEVFPHDEKGKATNSHLPQERLRLIEANRDKLSSAFWSCWPTWLERVPGETLSGFLLVSE